MTLIIKNQTTSDLSYLSGLVTVSASSNTTVSATATFPLSRDPGLIFDCKNANVILNDGSNDYLKADALKYLDQIATSIGGAVVGLVGSPVPSYAILVGGKDGSGNTKLGAMDSNGSLVIVGDIASGSADSGNPLKIASVYNSSLPTPSSGQRINLQSNGFGEVSIQFRNKYSNLTGNATTTVKSGSGRLHSICINDNTTGGTITVYDNTAGSGTKIMTLTVGTPSGGLLSSSGQAGPAFLGPFGLEFATGLTIVTSGSTSNNITVCYQ